MKFKKHRVWLFLLWDYCLLRILSTLLLSEHKFRFFLSAFQKKTKHTLFLQDNKIYVLALLPTPNNTCTEHWIQILNLPAMNNCKSPFLCGKYYFTEYFMHLLCMVCIIHCSFVTFKMCRIAHTINLCLAMLKSKWNHMGKDLIQDFHTKASWGHNKICDYTHLLSHRDTSI